MGRSNLKPLDRLDSQLVLNASPPLHKVAAVAISVTFAEYGCQPMIQTSGIQNEIEVYDERFLYLTLGNSWVEKLYTGTLWAEGPVYFADGDYLVWSDIPNNRMLRWAGGHVSVFRDFSNNSNGNTRDRQGRLITCEHGARRVTRTEPDGSITVLVDQFRGKKLNSPNDVVVKSDGTVWFTDPPYGILSDYEGHVAESEYGGCYVFRFDPATGALDPVVEDFNKPNGIAFSPDESKLYVVDTGRSHSPEGGTSYSCFLGGQSGKVEWRRGFCRGIARHPGRPAG